MSIFTWVRDALGIGLDRKVKMKTDLEIENLKSANREKLIKSADQKDVEKYDPNTNKLIKKLMDYGDPLMLAMLVLITIFALSMQLDMGSRPSASPDVWSSLRPYILILLLILAVWIIIRLVTGKKG